VLISTISVAEVVYLVEKVKLPEIALHRLVTALSAPRRGIVPVAFDLEVAVTLRRISRDDVSDMPDRIIAATALHLNLALVSRDRKIQASGIETIW